MGYSCTAAAQYSLDALADIVRGDSMSSNGTRDGGFWEVGRENDDGAITGTVYKPLFGDPSRVVRAGAFRIESCGKISRFPGSTASERAKAEREGARLYVKFHASHDWRATARALLTLLHLPSEHIPAAPYWWPDVEAVAQGYQRESGCMFLVMPACEATAVCEFLEGLLDNVKRAG